MDANIYARSVSDMISQANARSTSEDTLTVIRMTLQGLEAEVVVSFT